MTNYWEFNIFERIVLFATLSVQWTLVMLLTGAVLNEHAKPAASPPPLDKLYWIIVGGFALALFAYPVGRGIRNYGPIAIRRVKARWAE